MTTNASIPLEQVTSNISMLLNTAIVRKKKGDESNITAEDMQSYKIADIVNLYIPPIILVAGNVLNILSIMVMRSRHFRNISTSIYMIACAVNDAGSVSISLTSHWLYVNFPHVFVRTENSHIMCKFFNFFGWGNCDYSIYITAAMTVDRAIAIMYPLKVSVLNLTRRAKITTFILLLVVTVKEFHFMMSSDIVPITRRDRLCDVKEVSPTYHYFYTKVWPWIHIGCLIICFIAIIVSNVIIVWHVRQSAEGTAFMNAGERERTYSETSINNNGSRSKLRQLTIMLLAQSTTLILLTFPFSFHLAIAGQIPDLYTDPVKKASNQLAFSIVFYLLYSNKCVNFTIYCISGHRFRLALWEMFHCRQQPRRNSFTMIIKPVISASQTTISTITSISPIDKQVRELPTA